MGSGLAPHGRNERRTEDGGWASSWSFDWSGIWATGSPTRKIHLPRPDRFSQVFRSFFIMQGAKERQGEQGQQAQRPVALLRPRRLRLAAAGLRRGEGTRG